MIKKLKKAIDIAQRAQRNYDLSKTIPDDHLQTLIHAATNSPSKQNETHYGIKVYNDREKIEQIYNCTKRFLLFNKKNKEKGYKDINGKFWQDEDRSVTNSQILANTLFVFFEDDGNPRGGTHILGKESTDVHSESYQIYKEQKSYSIGIAVGELILSATLLGYKTGICSAFDPQAVAKIINTENTVKLLVGIGFENIDTDRRFHAQTLNKDIPTDFRNGPLELPWRFPSFEKNVKVYLNDTFLD